jgi:hypothetical protein
VFVLPRCCLVLMDSGRVLGIASRMFEGLKDRVREKTIFWGGEDCDSQTFWHQIDIGPQ